MCPLCSIDPRPIHFGNDRKCAFAANGEFTPDNWNCATINALLDGQKFEIRDLHGFDESLEVIYRRSEDAGNIGWIVLTRYKHRGRTSTAAVVGDFWPPKLLTLEIATEWLQCAESISATR